MKILILFFALCLSTSVFAQEADSLDTEAMPENAIMFLDSVRISDATILSQFSPEDLSSVTVVKGKPALAIDPTAEDGVIFIFTKKFARHYIWKVLSGASKEYLTAVPSSEMTDVMYVLNGSLLTENSEFALSDVTRKNLVSVKVIDAKELKKKYKTTGKVGVIVEANL